MTELFKTQEVRSQRTGALVGFRLTVSPSGETLLVFADQHGMPGFRVGDRFVADIGEELTCTTVLEVATESRGKDVVSAYSVNQSRHADVSVRLTNEDA